VAEFYRENVHFSWTEFEVSDSSWPEPLLVTSTSHAAQRQFFEKSAFEEENISTIISFATTFRMVGKAL
jgi:hypothetical protein